jgi:putative PEP-CTERM system TPR-repeat lipoprotein
MSVARSSSSGTLRLHRIAVAALLALACSLASSAPDGAAARFYEDALARYEKHDIPGAIVQLKNALQIDKNMLPVQVLLGKALLQNGEAIAAEVALGEALRLGVNRAEVVLPLAQAYLAQGKQTAMLDLPQFAPAGLPGNVQLQLQLLRAGAFADVGDVRGAMRSIDEARVINSKVPEVWLAEVPVRIRTRQFREASAAVDRALALAPGSAEALYQRGSISHVEGDLRATLASYNRALSIDPAHIEARIARAGLHIDLQQPGEADKDVAELQRLAPDEPRGAYLRALLAERANDMPTARSALNEVTGLIDPVPIDFIRFRPQLLMLNGLAHYGLNEREKAKPYLELFQKVQGNSAASKLLAQVYMGEGNMARASEILENYLKAQPADLQAMALMASAQMAQGRHAKATALMQDALRTSDAPELHTALGLSLLGGGQSGDGLLQLEAAFKKDPGQTQAGAALVGFYLRDGQPAKAVAVAETLVKQQPSNGGFHNLLGMARGRSGNVAGAKASLEEAIRLDDTLMPAKLNLARLDMATRAYESAQTRLTALLRSDEKNVDVLMEMASLARQRGQAEDTQRWLEKANDYAGPRDLRAGLALVDFHLGGRRPAPALAVSKSLLAKAPDDVSVLLLHSRAQLANADMFGARSTLTNATRLAAYDPASQLQVARLQMAADNPSGAAYSLDKALSTRPDYLPALALMTEVDLRQNDAAKAEKRARQIVEINPKRAIGHSLLGDIAMTKGQGAVAVDSYRRAYQLEPSTSTLLKLFRAQLPQDGGKAAMQLADQWLKQHPKDIAVRKAAGDGHARAGDFKLARISYEGVLKLVPEDAEALNNLANVLLHLKDPAAVGIAQQALAQSPSNADVIDTLGWALFINGQTDRALQTLRDARLRAPANPEIRFHLASVLAKAGRKNEARDELEAALKTGRGFESAGEAETLLRSLR